MRKRTIFYKISTNSPTFVLKSIPTASIPHRLRRSSHYTREPLVCANFKLRDKLKLAFHLSWALAHHFNPWRSRTSTIHYCISLFTSCRTNGTLNFVFMTKADSIFWTLSAFVMDDIGMFYSGSQKRIPSMLRISSMRE